MRPECWRDVLWLEMCSCEVSRCVPALVSSPGAPPLWTQDMAGAEHGRHLLSSSTLLEDSYHSQLLMSCWQLLSHVWWARIYVLHLCLEDENKWIWEKIMIMSGSNRCQQKYFLFAKSERILHHNLWTLLEEISCLVLASLNGAEGRRLSAGISRIFTAGWEDFCSHWSFVLYYLWALDNIVTWSCYGQQIWGNCCLLQFSMVLFARILLRWELVTRFVISY